MAGCSLVVGACGEDSDSPAEPPAADTPASEPDAAEPTPKIVEVPSEPVPSGRAVVRVGGLLFSSSAGEQGVELPPLSASDEPKVAGMTVNAVGVQDDRIIVETLITNPPEHHCAATLDGLADFRLRMYVSPDDLLPVTTKTYRQELPDGTSVQLTAGVPVPKGATSVVARGTPLTITVPDDHLGRYYEPAPANKSGGLGTMPTVEGKPLTYGGTILAEDKLFSRGGVQYFELKRKSSESLVTVRNPCAEIVALVSGERMDPAPEAEMARREAGILGVMAAEEGHFLASPYGGAFARGGSDEDVWGGLTGTEVGEAFGVGGLGLVGGGPVQPYYSVKSGTSVLWPDGSVAGQVLAEHRFDNAARPIDGRSCFDVPLTSAESPTIVLCFAPADVSEHTPPPTIGGGGAGGLGTIGGLGTLGGADPGGGGGGIGFGGGSGTGAGGAAPSGRGRKVPRVRQAKAEVKGSLDKDIIRRIVRAHINEVRYCYNMGLVKDPTLAGKVTVSFVIAGTGKVASAVIDSHTLADKGVANCVAKAVKRWKFPKPVGGGVVAVKYPFVLAPG